MDSTPQAAGARKGRPRVVVTGIGLVTPLGCSTDGFWKKVQSGVSATGPISSFDASPFPSRVGAEVRGFDARTWIPARTIRRSGPESQLAIAAAAMALEDSGLRCVPGGIADAGILVGTGHGSIASVEGAYRNFFTRGWRENPVRSVPLCMPNAPGSQVALEFGLKGPSFTLSSACASGAAAIATAVELIRGGVIRRALAGGVDKVLLPGVFSIWCQLGVLSTRNDDPAGACAPFSADRDGLVLGEGACILTLERLEEAEGRGAPEYAEIAGWASNCGAESITAPCLESEAEAMVAALADAGLEREDVGYVNAHGTATAINDVVETQAIKLAFGNHARRLAVSSTKSMIGHTMGASSAIECAVTALALRDQVFPPTANLRIPDPECDLDYVPGTARAARFRAALSNSFGFGGTNVILVLTKPGC